MVVLLTLAAGQFLMTLDSSVMNVSIATVAKDVGTTVTGIQGAITAYTLVMAALMITGAKIGGDHRPQACVRDRLRDLRVRVVYDGDRAELAGAAVWLVVSGGCGCGADPARHRGSCGRQLRDRAPPGRVRHGRGRGRDRGRHRAAHRRHRDHLLLVALGVRGRGRARPRHPPPRPPDRRRTVRKRVRASTWSARCSRRSGWRCSSSASSARASGGGFSRRRARPRGRACRRRSGWSSRVSS